MVPGLSRDDWPLPDLTGMSRSSRRLADIVGFADLTGSRVTIGRVSHGTESRGRVAGVAHVDIFDLVYRKGSVTNYRRNCFK